MSALSPKSFLDPGEDLLDVRAGDVSVKRLARGPALDERDAARIVYALVQRVEDASLLSVSRLHEGLEGLGGLRLLAGLGGEGPDDNDFRDATSPLGRARYGRCFAAVKEQRA